MTRSRSLLLVMALVGAVSFAASAAGLDVRSSYGARVTGDEPYYLLTAQSLGRDGDLDISDEIAGAEFRAYHEIPLDEQTRPLAGGRRVAPHDPGLPALLALPMRLGGWVAAKLLLSALAGLLGALMVWVAVRRFAVPLGAAGLTVAIFGASAPLAVYGAQVYPEIPAALAVAGAIACLTGPLRARSVAGAAACVVALPWLSVKYAPVAAALAAVGLVRLWRFRSRPRAAVLWFAGGLGLAGLVFAAAHLAWYGGLTPYATGDHFTSGQLSVVGLAPDFPSRARRLIGLLVDREFGLVAWQPAWMLVVAALAALLRKREPGWAALALPLAAGWLNATFVALTMQGWWWPGRQVVVVLPCAVLAIAWWTGARRGRVAALAAAGSLGVVSYGRLVVEGLEGRITWVVDFFETANPFYRAWSMVLPDYLDVTTMTWVWQSIWLVACAGLAWWGWCGPAPAKRGRSIERPGRAAPREAATSLR